jgi:hypothetical protein
MTCRQVQNPNARARPAGDARSGTASSGTPTAKRRLGRRPAHCHRHRARKGEWESAYFDALSRGHIKATAAGLAGVSERCAYKRAKEDSDFAEREWIAYHLGSAALMKMAFERISDPVRPSDRILIHLLAARGIKPIREHEASDQLRAPIATGDTPWFEHCTLEEKRKVLEIAERAMSRASAVPV